MTAPRPLTNRGRVVRWPAVVLLAAVIAVMVVVDADRDPPEAEGVLLERPVVATSGRPGALSSTWYCSAGTIVADGVADHTLVLGNASGREARIELTVFSVLAPQPIEIDLEQAEDIGRDAALTPPQAVDLGATEVSLTVGPRQVERLRVADFEGVGGEHAAVLVESDAGELLVEHIVAGPAGAGMTPCASASADAWYFGGGTTRKGARQILTIFNPFPGDAVVDLTFTADAGVRAPQIYEGLVVPSGTVLPVEITGVVTLFDIVSSRLEVRTGRVVTERLMILDGSEGQGGLSVAAGSVAPRDEWVFPASGPPDAVDGIVIHNPSTEDEALVDVEVYLDVPELNGTVEPIGVTVRPGRTEVVVLTEGAERVTAGRLVDASGRILDDVGYWAAVRSLNGVPVVADRLTVGEGPVPIAFSSSPGVPVAATRHLLSTGDGVGEVVVVNPAPDRIARLELRMMVDGQEFVVAEAEEVARGSRLVLDLGGLGLSPDAILAIDATDPVLVERRFALGDNGSVTALAVPVAGTVSAPELPLGP